MPWHFRVNHHIGTSVQTRSQQHTRFLYVLSIYQNHSIFSHEVHFPIGADFAKKVKASARKSKQGLSDAAAINTIRWKLFETLKATGLPVISGTGGKTAYHRNIAGLPKTHYYDAAAVAIIPKRPKDLTVAVIKSVGYGRRDLRKFSVKKPGFNYGYLKLLLGNGKGSSIASIIRRRASPVDCGLDISHLKQPIPENQETAPNSGCSKSEMGTVTPPSPPVWISILKVGPMLPMIDKDSTELRGKLY